MDIRALARQGGVNEAVTVIAISVLAKMALVSLATKSSTKK
jgi:hypothetical protein